jgi:3-dehydroquinate synthase
MVLNFGHTFGHAIEQITRYRRFLHGEAVLVGMKMAVGLSRLAGLLAPSDETRILALLDIFPIPPAGRIDAEALYAQMGRDKKMKGGTIHFVLLDGIGKAAIVPGVEKGKVIEIITNTLAR